MGKNIHKKSYVCQVSGKTLPIEELVSARSVRLPIIELIKKDVPDFNENSYICLDDLNRYRQKYIHDMVIKERGELSELENEVLSAMKDAEFISRDISAEESEQLTFGQRIADIVARFGGSWTFIISFFIIITGWIFLNAFILISRPFDPYPFILLNLVLSCLAAIQAPIIMMSQNRQETKDRLRSQHDYQVNLKSELEIRQLHEKIDHLISRQFYKLFEIQELQVDLLQELIEQREEKEKGHNDF